MKSLEELAPGANFSIDTDTRTLASKPELSVLVSRVLASWSFVEAFVSVCANSLLAGRSEVAEKFYQVLSDNSLQYLALYEAAKVALPSADAELFCSALRAVKKLGRGRHLLAHGLYAEVEGITDLVIYEQRDFAKLTKVFFTSPNAGESRQDQMRRAQRDAARNAKVLTRHDLEGFLADIGLASDLAMDAATLAAPVHPDKDGARKRIRETLAKVNAAS